MRFIGRRIKGVLENLPCLCPTKSSRRLISLHCVACLSTPLAQLWRPRSSRGKGSGRSDPRTPTGCLHWPLVKSLSGLFFDYKVLRHRVRILQPYMAKPRRENTKSSSPLVIVTRHGCGVHDNKEEPSSTGAKFGRRSSSWLQQPDILDCSPTMACDVGPLHYLHCWPC